MTTPSSVIKTAPPGPPGPALIGNLLHIGRDPLTFLTRCAEEYGDVVLLRLGPIPVYVLNNPDDIEYVLVTNNRNYAKVADQGAERRLFGAGLVTSDGAVWQRQRQLIQPAFHRERIAAYATTMAALTETMLDSWQDGQTRDIHQDMMQLTLQIVVETLFGSTLNTAIAPTSAAVDVLMSELATRMNQPLQLPLALPTPGNLRFRRAITQLDHTIFAMIRARRADAHLHNDMLALLLCAQDEQEHGMSDQQLRDEVMTMMLAGHETTALALSWACYLLAQHPHIETQLVAELRAVLGGHAPSMNDIPHLRFTEMVVKETMRIYPPAWIIAARRARREDRVGGYHIPAGAMIVASQWIMHRNPRFFQQPQVFNPARWQDEAMHHLPRFAYFPFGGGPRRCIGHSFAMVEATLLLAAMVQCFQMRCVSDLPVLPQPSITLRPKGGVHMRITARP